MGMTNKPPAKPRIRLTLSFRCEENWEAMESAGPDARHCRLCDKNVIDLTGKTAGEVMALYAESGGSLCGRGLYDTVREEFVLPNVRQVAQRAALAGALAASASCVDEGVTASENHLASDDGGTDGGDYDDAGAGWDDGERAIQAADRTWTRPSAGGPTTLGEVGYADSNNGNAPDAGPGSSSNSDTADAGTEPDSGSADGAEPPRIHRVGRIRPFRRTEQVATKYGMLLAIDDND